MQLDLLLRSVGITKDRFHEGSRATARITNDMLYSALNVAEPPSEIHGMRAHGALMCVEHRTGVFPLSWDYMAPGDKSASKHSRKEGLKKKKDMGSLCSSGCP